MKDVSIVTTVLLFNVEITNSMKEQSEQESLDAELRAYHSYNPSCKRCNDNGCPACDGTVGNPYNPDGY